MVYIPIYLSSNHQSIYIYICIYISILTIYVCIYLSIRTSMNLSTCLSTYLSPVVPGRCSQWRSRMSIRVARARLTHTAHHPSKQTINHSLTISNQSLMINRQLIPNIKSRTIYVGQSINFTNTQSTIYHEQSIVRHNI